MGDCSVDMPLLESSVARLEYSMTCFMPIWSLISPWVSTPSEMSCLLLVARTIWDERPVHAFRNVSILPTIIFTYVKPDTAICV